jgi:hypothetical protein
MWQDLGRAERGTPCVFLLRILFATSNSLHIKWKQDFSRQIFEERFSRFHYKTLQNVSLIGLLAFVRNAANSSRHIHQIQNLTFGNSTLFHYMGSVNTDKMLRAGQPWSRSLSGEGKNTAIFKPSRLPGFGAQSSLLYNGYSRRIPWRWPEREANHSMCCSSSVLDWESADCYSYMKRVGPIRWIVHI